MKNPFEEILTQVRDSDVIIKRYMQQNFDCESLQKEFQQTVSSMQLQVMLYGAYNAGKSTLINALLAKEAAVVNDVPTTDKVDYYNWEGVELLDTPGVNAPIEHEQVTEEQLKRVGAVLFVVREGDLDAKNLYIRLFDIIKKGKKVFVLLNHQLTQSGDQVKAIHKINQTIALLASDYSVTAEQCGHITVLPLNVLTAYKGRLKKVDELVAHSGFTSFVDALKQWLIIDDKENHRLNTLKQQVNECWFIPVITVVKNQLDSQSSDESKIFRESQQLLESKKRGLRNDVSHFISRQVNQLKNPLLHILENSDSEQEAIHEVQVLFSPVGEKIEAWLADEIGAVNKEYIRLSCDNSNIQPFSKNGESSSNQELLDQLTNQLKSSLKDKENLKQLLLLGRKLKIPGIKGRWEKTLGAWAGKAAVAVQVLTFAYDTYKANADQEKENQAKRLRTVELYQAAEAVCELITDRFVQSSYELIGLSFDNEILAITRQLEELSDQSNSLKSDYDKLCNSQNLVLNSSF
jgi:tRNA U34 5-carboxymethylaminomethyl modifying GTPase MnmE/TrmE